MNCFSHAQIHRQLLPSPSKKQVQIRKPQAEPQNQKAIELIKKVERGIKLSTVGLDEHDFGSLISISMSTAERKYVSANQVISMLQNYFSNRRPVSFEFSHINATGPAPYATGRLVYIYKGNQESAQWYIALTHRESRWVINQLNIY